MLEFVTENLGLFAIREVAILDSPLRNRVSNAVSNLLERVLTLFGAEGSTEILLSEDVGGVDAPRRRNLDTQLLECDGAVAIVRNSRITTLPDDLVIGVYTLGGEVALNADSRSLWCDCHVLNSLFVVLLLRRREELSPSSPPDIWFQPLYVVVSRNQYPRWSIHYSTVVTHLSTTLAPDNRRSEAVRES